MAEQYDSLNASIPQVTEHLDSLPEDQRDAELARILEAERTRDDGTEPRVGILSLNPNDPAPHDPENPENAGDKDLGSPRGDQQELEKSRGFLGDTGDTPEGTEPVKPVDESAPEGVQTSRAKGVAVVGADETAELAKPPATMKQQKAPKLEGEAYQQGYLGELPDADNRPDLTLKGVLGQNDQG